MLLLQQTFPLLFDIVSVVEGDQLPEALTAYIIDVLEKVKSPFSRNGSIPDAVQLDVHRNCNWMCAVLCNWMCAEMM